MGRQTRQSRRAQERKQATNRARHPRRSDINWSVMGPAAIIAVAVLAFVGYLIFKPGSSTAGTPTSTLGGGPQIGQIKCGSNTMLVTYHVHAHIAVFNKGKPELIGADFGHYYTGDCTYWLHAHDTQGIIHIESPRPVVPTLQELYGIEKQTLGKNAVVSFTAPAGEQRKVWVKQKPYYGNPYKVKLYQHTDVTVEFGPPWEKPVKFDFAAHQV